MREDILKLFAGEIRRALEKTETGEDELQEIRLRAGRPVTVRTGGREYLLRAGGGLLPCGEGRPEVRAVEAGADQIRETFAYVSQYSYCAFTEEISRGYLTAPGGHRVGLCGKSIWENGQCRGMKYISFLNVRIARQIKGCGEEALKWLYRDGRVRSTLIVSPPGAGKTTLLRDLIRLISDGNRYAPGVNVAVVDERSELAACFQGVPQHDLGARTDVLDGCDKGEGMMMVIRAMNPRVVAADEIGGAKDVRAIGEAVRCGCAVLATAHGTDMEELREKPRLARLIAEGVFDRYLFLSGERRPGEITACLDGKGRTLYRRGEEGERWP